MYDMISAYRFSLRRKFKKDRNIDQIIFNLGFENLSIIKMAKNFDPWQNVLIIDVLKFAPIANYPI